MQFDIGISTIRCFPPNGTAGFERSFVNGYRRVPLPPPKMIDNTLDTVVSLLVDQYGKSISPNELSFQQKMLLNRFSNKFFFCL